MAEVLSPRWCFWRPRRSGRPLRLDHTQYAKDRHQFDKPLGAFRRWRAACRAVADLDGAERLVREAAWAGATGQPARSLAPMAKLFACSTFRDITAMAQQIFGGIGSRSTSTSCSTSGGQSGSS